MSDQAIKREIDEIAAWQKIADAEVGHVFVDRMEGELRFMIRRGYSGLCAYVGVPIDHNLAGRHYDDLAVPIENPLKGAYLEDADIDCHGGLTFSAAGTGRWAEGYWWYGWDYAHLEDAMIFSTEAREALEQGIPEWEDHHAGDTKWTVAMVEEDSRPVIAQFQDLIRRIHAGPGDPA